MPRLTYTQAGLLGDLRADIDFLSYVCKRLSIPFDNNQGIQAKHLFGEYIYHNIPLDNIPTPIRSLGQSVIYGDLWCFVRVYEHLPVSLARAEVGLLFDGKYSYYDTLLQFVINMGSKHLHAPLPDITNIHQQSVIDTLPASELLIFLAVKYTIQWLADVNSIYPLQYDFSLIAPAQENLTKYMYGQLTAQDIPPAQRQLIGVIANGAPAWNHSIRRHTPPSLTKAILILAMPHQVLTGFKARRIAHAMGVT